MKHLPAGVREAESDDALVDGVGGALDEAECLRPVDESDHGVVANEKVSGELADRRALRTGVTAHCQE
jgi:hypothetical protein